MELFRRQIWINFLALVPATSFSLLVVSIAFLRFYDATDFTVLGYVTYPRQWSNRLTVAAFMVALVNFCVEWNRRNRETSRLASAETQSANDRAAEIQRRAEEREQAARRARIQNRWIVLQIRHQLEPSEQTRAALTDFATFLQDYGDTMLSL